MSSSTGNNIDCYGVNSTNLAKLLSEGYSIVGGPYTSQAQCLVNCGTAGASWYCLNPPSGSGSGSGGGGGTIPTICCPDDLLPEVLCLTITGATTDGCNFSNLQLTWNGSEWISEAVSSCGNYTFSLNCQNLYPYGWDIGYNGGESSGGQGSIIQTSCSPFLLTATPEFGDLFGADDTWTITTCSGSSGGITTPCCSNNIPSTLNVTIIDAGGCSCLGGITFQIQNLYGISWSGQYTPSGCANSGYISVVLYCYSEACVSCNCSNFYMLFQCPSGSGINYIAGPPESCQCSPFEALFIGTSPGSDGCCNGNITVIVTQ